MNKILLIVGAAALAVLSSPAAADDISADVNLNNTACLTSIDSIGSTTYVNICTGVETVVPWGSTSWAAFGLLVTVLLAMAAFLIFIFRDLSR